MISIVIPAHNEGRVIERLLESLTARAGTHEFDIIVICNGCTDDTAARARACPYGVTVLETDVPSKVNALNMGDEAARAFPRIYSDADIDLDTDSARRLAETLVDGPVHLASPRMNVDLTDRPWTVRAYYDIWTSLPYYKHKIGGVFGLGAEGRARLGAWPDLIADDTFASTQFDASEQTVLTDASFTMIPPKSLGALRHIEARRHAGAGELVAKFPEFMQRRGIEQKAALRRLFLQPWRWPALGVYLWVKLGARAQIKRQAATGQHKAWNRDESSRG